MTAITNLMYATIRWSLRDRILHAMVGVGMLLLLLAPVLSLFSMRQVQELSVTITLSSVSLTLLVLGTLLGASSIWRDVERRYTASVLGLPISRGSFVLGKFAGICVVLGVTAAFLGGVSYLAISVSSMLYPSDTPLYWANVWAAIGFDLLKYLLLTSFAMCFSALSTSFFLPFFGTISVYLAGTASQEVFEFISGPNGRHLSPLVREAAQVLYYLIPNLSAFNLKVQAVYGLALEPLGMLFTLAYFVVYTAIVLTVCVWVFSRRELP